MKAGCVLLLLWGDARTALPAACGSETKHMLYIEDVFTVKRRCAT